VVRAVVASAGVSEPPRSRRVTAAINSAAVIRTMNVSQPVVGSSALRSQVDPDSLTYRLERALVSVK
jgi:hypothetical protein